MNRGRLSIPRAPSGGSLLPADMSGSLRYECVAAGVGTTYSGIFVGGALWTIV